MTIAARDPILSKVMHAWTNRFLMAGVYYHDIQQTLGRIDSWDSWAREWQTTAAEHEALAEQWLARCNTLSAAEALQRTSVYYHVSAFVYFRDMELHDHGYRKMVECYERSIPLSGGSVEKVEIPFEDTPLKGLLSLPRGSEQPPVVVLIPGLDSTKETRHGERHPYLARGMAVLSLDGPGQGEMSLTTKIRPDYEAPIKAVIDYIETRPEFDASRVALSGASLGGYYSSRAAAFEPRVRACVENCGAYKVSDNWDTKMQVTREAYQYYLGARDMEDAERLSARLTLEGAAGNITCPLLVIQGKLDPLVHWHEAERIYNEASGPKELHLFEDGNHTCNNIPHKTNPIQYDWLARHLDARVSA